MTINRKWTEMMWIKSATKVLVPQLGKKVSSEGKAW